MYLNEVRSAVNTGSGEFLQIFPPPEIAAEMLRQIAQLLSRIVTKVHDLSADSGAYAPRSPADDRIRRGGKITPTAATVPAAELRQSLFDAASFATVTEKIFRQRRT